MPNSKSAEDIVEELLSKELEYLVFPSHFDIAIRIKKALSDYTKPIEYIADIVKCDPVIAGRLLQEASRRNVAGLRVTNIAKAINLLGYEHVKRVTLLTVCKQLEQSLKTVRYASLTRLIWLNSLYGACAAHVLADYETSFDPEEAFMCAILVNVGAFYLLYQAGSIPCLTSMFDEVVLTIDRYYLNRTRDILTMFEMSQSCLKAVSIDIGDNEAFPEDLKTLRNVVMSASSLATAKYPWVTSETIDASYFQRQDLIPDIDEMFEELRKNNY